MLEFWWGNLSNILGLRMGENFRSYYFHIIFVEFHKSTVPYKATLKK